MPQEIIVNTYHGTKENNSGRCIYNLKLIHKSPLAEIDYKCIFQCNGANHSRDSVDPSKESVNQCNFYIDCEDYYGQICALRVRAKRKEDKQMFLSEGDNKCLECTEAENRNCEHYVNVRYVVDEICAHKIRIEKKRRNGFKLEGLENNCSDCLGDKHLLERCSSHYSIKEIMEFNNLYSLIKA